MIRALLALLLGLSLIGPAQALPDERRLAVKADHMLRWIERQTDYSIEGVELRVVYRTPDELWRMIYEDRERTEGFAVYAAFSEGTIFLRNDFRLGIDDSFLFHELVHLVQHENGAEFPCRGAMEKEAYDLQTKWAHAHSGYIVNDFFVLAMTQCESGF